MPGGLQAGRRHLAARVVVSGLRLSELWAVLLPLLLLTFILMRQIGFVDLGYHLRAGEWTVASGHPLDRDVFTHTFANQAWINQNWLAQVGLYGTWRLGGLQGLLLLNALLFAAGFAVLLRVCVRRTSEVRVAGAACIGALLPALFNTAVRPQSFSWLLMAVLVYLLERSQTRPRILLWCIPMFALWANLHGAFAVGLAFLAVESSVAGWRWARRREDGTRFGIVAGAMAASAAAALLNPWGPKVYGYVFDIGGNPIIRGAIEEWKPPDLATAAGALFFLSVGMVVAAIAVSPVRLRGRDLMMLAVGAALGLIGIRNGLWWTIAAAPPLASLLRPLAARVRFGDPARRTNLVIVAALLALAALTSPWPRSASPLIPPDERSLVNRRTPVAAARYLRSHPVRGNLLNSQSFGSYLEFAAPEVPVFLDSRIEMFSAELWDDYTRAMRAEEGWREVLDRYSIGTIAVARRPQSPIVAALSNTSEWRLVHRDEIAVIFESSGAL